MWVFRLAGGEFRFYHQSSGHAGTLNQTIKQYYNTIILFFSLQLVHYLYYFIVIGRLDHITLTHLVALIAKTHRI